jgi:hypothetical protein
MSRSVEETIQSYAQNSFRSYLDGLQTLNWAVSAVKISGVRGQALVEILSRLKDEYGETGRYKEMYSACKELEWC